MRKIVAGLFMTLDGVVEASETWTSEYFDAEVRRMIQSQFDAADALLLGRRTYEMFAGYWPHQSAEDEPLADVINNIAKLVVSATLTSVEWRNSTLIGGDVLQALSELKELPGKNLYISGSPTLVRSLLGAGLLDELWLLVGPIVLGTGIRLFEGWTNRVPLELVECHDFRTGFVSVLYRPPGNDLKEVLMQSSLSHSSNFSVSQLRAVLNGRVIAPDDDGLRRGAHRLLRRDRPPAGGHRPGRGRGRRRAGRVARARDRAGARRPQRRPQRRRSQRLRGRHRARPRRTCGRWRSTPSGRTAWAETGLTAGEYTTAAGAHGLATGFGDTGSVGIGGITLGGGVGYLVRKYGLTIDNLLAADVVTADGELLRVDAETHPDLFWAIRGGGGNFGVATRFQFRLHEVDTVVGGMLILPATPDVIASFIAEAEAAPEELSTIANVMPAPPMPFVPAEHHGRLVIMATDGLRRRRRGRGARRRAVPGAGHADRRHGPADALPGDLPAGRGRLPPGRGGAHDVRRHDRARARPRRSSITSEASTPRWAWRSSACSAGRWPACPSRPPPSPTARGGSW